MKKRRALILYASMTGNTEKIANCFKEAFEEYCWDVKMFKMTAGADWLGEQENLYFDDYDVICVGSPIIAGSPMNIVRQALALHGGGEDLHDILRKKLEKEGREFKPGRSPELFFWRRNFSKYPGILTPGDSRPVGIVFTTYGGGFFGSGECLATLETMKMYLELKSVDVIGKFACPGAEKGPAGYPLGEKPRGGNSPQVFTNKTAELADVCDPVQYDKKNGEKVYGSYFYHHDLLSRPNDRDLVRAKGLVLDIVEDIFLSYDGERKIVKSEYITIS